MKLGWLRDQRGGILLFTTILAVPLMIIFGGLAMDLAYHGTVDDELQRAMDAAALAGAGNLGFDLVIPLKVRTAARDYAKFNTYRTGQITLDLNEANDLNGNIVTGIWEGGAFKKEEDGTKANAVLCRTSTSIPTSFLRLIGLNSLPAAAQAIAISNPPVLPGCGLPVLPIGVTQCNFDQGGAFNNSTGCGTAITFIRSQTQCEQGVQDGNTAKLCNTGTYVSLDGSTPNVPYLTNAINNPGTPGNCNVSAPAGGTTEANNGMLEPVFAALADQFSQRYTTLSESILKVDGTTVKDINGNDLSKGWETGVMVLKTACPPGPMPGTIPIAVYAKFVITQVFYKQQGCVVTNLDPQAQSYCYNPDGSARKDNDLRAVFGYFKCGSLGDVATFDPVPRAALAPKLRLVQ